MKSHITRAVIGSLGLAGAAAVLLGVGTPATATTTVTTEDGDSTCTELGYDYGFKPNAGGAESTAGTFEVRNGDIVVTWSYAGGSNSTIAWSSNFNASAVIVGGGDTANVYRYDPPKPSDKGLRTPMENAGYPPVSHVEFCFDYNLMVTKTASTSFTRTYTWDIDKMGSETTSATCALPILEGT